jgi:hypothetical protein
MATQSMVRTARRQTSRGPTSQRQAQKALPTRAVHFDGRDVTEPVGASGRVAAREIVVCQCCGTVRDAGLAFCCEFAMNWNTPKARTAVAAPAAYVPAPRVAVVSAA